MDNCKDPAEVTCNDSSEDSRRDSSGDPHKDPLDDPSGDFCKDSFEDPCKDLHKGSCFQKGSSKGSSLAEFCVPLPIAVPIVQKMKGIQSTVLNEELSVTRKINELVTVANTVIFVPFSQNRKAMQSFLFLKHV